MFALPKYILDDIQEIQNQLSGLVINTEFLIADLETVKVKWEDDTVAGEFRYDPDLKVYTFFISKETLDGLTESIG